ncbi:MAG: Single-stranded-DNA-specific exonuclease RecJ [Verrucomicrobia subdivision 3 bacterium]|nr:Single-stranded-DNA-specific exonuclease RecJ [Limisphaerales bacterium]MCS1414064.1 Single-stranded-DNA-specific exonuclease RecJ [Limisphaerales bacterium]
MNFRWSIFRQQRSVAERLSHDLGVSELLAQCLINRGLADSNEADRFLRPQLKNLANPLEVPNMEAAIDRLFQAREQKEKVVVFGDYDVDGVTSMALLIEVMEEFGWRLDFYLPHRLNEGYGLSRAAVENCLKRFSPAVVLAVDCGSTAVDTIAFLNEQGVNVIVLDHHQVSDPAPSAVALVNPQINGGQFCELSSVGLAFKLAHAIIKRCRQLNQPSSAHDYDLKPLLDLVALGTVADLVPLVRENRIMVTSGLNRLNQTRRVGVLALMEVAHVRDQIGVFEISFQLGPRINASGRLEDAMASLNLLLCDDVAAAKKQALELDACNRERQQIEKGIADQAICAVRERFNAAEDFVIVQGDVEWHVGVVGIVASRVLREFYRPTIILGGEGSELRGSGRSVEGFDLAEALRECEGLLLRHGGHAMAAGLSIAPENLDAFRSRINQYAKENISRECLAPMISLDAEVPLGAMRLSQMEELIRLRPFGAGNVPLQFVTKNVMLQSLPHRMGKEGQHATFRVTDEQVSKEVLWWNCGSNPMPSGHFDLAFAPEINEYNGRRSIQLKLLHWRPTA